VFSRHLPIFLILASGWCLLSGHYNALLLTLGLVSCWLSILIYHRVTEGKVTWMRFTSPWQHVKYVCWLLIEIVKSSIDVIRLIINPSAIDPQFAVLDCAELDETGKVIYANSITLTPGTVATELSGNKLHIHGLNAKARAALQGGNMLSKVEKLGSSSSEEHG
jgi:multicomponent Na+:H+ antiporter subunit E